MLHIKTAHETIIIPFSTSGRETLAQEQALLIKEIVDTLLEKKCFQEVSEMLHFAHELAEEKGIVEEIEQNIEVREIPDLASETFSGLGLA